MKSINGKRGNIGGFMSVVLGIGIGVVTIAVLAIMLGAFRTSLTANSYEYNVTSRGLSFLDESTKQFSTAGTITGVTLLLAIIALIGFGAYAGYQKMR
jgi:hypothetical protein